MKKLTLLTALLLSALTFGQTIQLFSFNKYEVMSNKKGESIWPPAVELKESEPRFLEVQFNTTDSGVNRISIYLATRNTSIRETFEIQDADYKMYGYSLRNPKKPESYLLVNFANNFILYKEGNIATKYYFNLNTAFNQREWNEWVKDI